MENLATILIVIHASLGTIALISGAIAMLTKKGGLYHKKVGKVFYYSMLWCGISAIIIAVLPNHESGFFIAVGVFSLYFNIAGKRALQFRKPNHNFQIDIWISIIMLFTGVLMILLPVISSGVLHVILAVFGAVGAVFACRDLYVFKHKNLATSKWLALHLSKFIGAYISAATAFIVVNQIIPGVLGWFLPGILGGCVIAYWIKKTKSV